MGIKKVKLDYRPVAKRKGNEIALIVSKEHINAVNRSIHNKLKRTQSTKSAKDYRVGNTSSNTLVKRKK